MEKQSVNRRQNGGRYLKKEAFPSVKRKNVPKESAHMGPAVAESFHGAGTKTDLIEIAEIAQILRRL